MCGGVEKERGWGEGGWREGGGEVKGGSVTPFEDVLRNFGPRCTQKPWPVAK